VTVPELSSQGGRARSHGTHVSTEVHLGMEARYGAEERLAMPELNSARRRGPGPCGSTGAHISKDVMSGTAGYVVALKSTSVGRCGLKLQLIWPRENTRSAPYLT
jgi:hypothetical protein